MKGRRLLDDSAAATAAPRDLVDPGHKPRFADRQVAGITPFLASLGPVRVALRRFTSFLVPESQGDAWVAVVRSWGGPTVQDKVVPRPQVSTE